MRFLTFIILLFIVISTNAQLESSNEISRIYIEAIIKNFKKSNPDSITNYRCNLYQKFIFERYENDSAEQSMPFLLLEALISKKHKLPDSTKYFVSSNNVVGNGDPALLLLPTQIDPFIVYNSSIKIWNHSFKNPFSIEGMRFYNYQVIDSSSDSSKIVKFHPHNTNKGVAGNFNISADGAILNYSMNGTATDSLFQISINQSFEIVDNNLWFPKMMTGNINIRSQNSIIKTEFKNQVSFVQLNPVFVDGDFNHQYPVTEVVKTKESEQNLKTKNEARTLLMLDSINRIDRDEQTKQFQKQLIEAKLPVGIFDIDIKKLIDYNDYEGFKPGIGLWTNQKVSNTFSTGGYYVRSLRIKDNKFGAGLKINLNKKNDTRLNFLWFDDYKETGVITFLDSYKPFSPESFRRFLSETMDRTNSFQLDFRTNLSNSFSVAFSSSYQDVTPQLNYRFFNDTSIVEQAYTLTEGGIKTKWDLNQNYNTQNQWSYPNIYINLYYGKGENHAAFEYTKIVGQIEENIKLSNSHTTTLRLNAGHIEGSYPSSILYSAFGSYKSIGIEVPFTFATMRLNEFAADQFISFHFSHDISLFKKSQRSFKPHLLLTTNIGKGAITTNKYQPTINDFNKIYYESGIVINNLLKNQLIEYGFSVHYRYGSYHLDTPIDNFAFKLALKYILE